MAYKTAESKVGKYVDVAIWNGKNAGLKAGDVVEGEIVDVEQFATKYGEMITFILGKEDGTLIKVTGQTDIRNKMQDVEDNRAKAGKSLIGTKVRLTYNGLTETANGAMKTYTVEYDEAAQLKFGGFGRLFYGGIMKKYDKEFNAYARRVVKSFNQRVLRAEKRGLKNLPSLRSVRELKAQYQTKDDLKRELSQLRQFNRDREALNYKQLGNETRLTNWEFGYIKNNLDELKSFYDREIEKAQQRAKDLPYSMGIREDLWNLEEKRDYLNRDLNELNKSELATFRKYLNQYKNRERTDNNFYQQFFETFDFLGRVSGMDKKDLKSIEQKINSLTPSQFYEFYKRYDSVSELFDYIPSPERAKYYKKIRDYEEAEKQKMLDKYQGTDNMLSDKMKVFTENLNEYIEEIKAEVKQL